MKKLVKYAFIFVAILLIVQDVEAQCAMCRASLESNMNTEDVKGSGINDGILYIMSLPYILFATVGFFLYRHYKKTH